MFTLVPSAPDNINAMEGEDFSMICMAKFDPSLNQTTLSWEFLGKNIENDTRHAMTEVMGTTKKSRLLIRKVIKEDAGDYMCKSYSFHTSVTQFKEMKITLGVTCNFYSLIYFSLIEFLNDFYF